MTTLAKLTLVAFVVLALQVSVVSDARIFGAMPDVMLLLAICAGLVAGPERGAIIAFCLGLSYDLLVQTPFGLSALTYCLIAYLVARVHHGVVRSQWLLPMITVAIASAAGIALFVGLGWLIGEHELLDPRFGEVIGGVTLVNFVASPLALRLMRWAVAPPDDASAPLRLRP